MNELLQKRIEMKRKKPSFRMQDAHILKRLKDRWRKPRGIDAKMRLYLKGYSKNVEPGYGSPALVRGLHKLGLKPIIVCNEKELKKINKGKDGVIISSAVGNKKRIDIIRKAAELSIKILNIRDPLEYIKKVEQKFQSKKAEKEKNEKEKLKKKTKEKKEDKLVEKVMSEEEKSAAEKKEKDKLLTKKEI